jgi:hypothetical protein
VTTLKISKVKSSKHAAIGEKNKREKPKELV